MADAEIDSNSRQGIIAASSADGKTPIRLYADPDTHRLLVEATAGVVGPGTSTDNAIPVWDGITGLTLKDSSVTIISGVVNATSYKSGGTSPVADGTYTVGSKITPISGNDGTITVKGGIITAIQQAT